MGGCGKKARPVRERFEKYYIPEPNSGCWLWLGTKQGAYGSFRVGSMKDGTRRVEYAHRLSYELHCGPIPDGLFIMHQCDNKMCVNPEHLKVGTCGENHKEAYERGLKTVQITRAKLSKDDILDIRASSEKYAILAKRYNVSYSTIAHTRNREIWKNI